MGASEGVDVVESMCPSEKLGMAVGSRAHLEAEAIAHRSWHRNLLMYGFHFVVLLVAGSAVKDTQCGFKVRAPVCAQHLMGMLLPDGVHSITLQEMLLKL